MVESAVNHAFQLLQPEHSRHLNVNCILEYLRKTQNEEIAERVFTNAANCMETGKDKFEIFFSLVSFTVNLLDLPYLDTVVYVIRLICDIVTSNRGRRDSFSLISENLCSEVSEEMEDINEKLHAFYARFDARSNDLDIFSEHGEDTMECAPEFLDNVNYKEIGVDFLIELEEIISKYKNALKEEILKSVRELLNAYVVVATMRYMMQILILSTIPDENMKSATKYIKINMEGDVKRRVAFLTSILKLNHKNAIFLSSFCIREFPLLHEFLKTKWSAAEEQSCLPDINDFLSNKNVALHSVKFPGYWMNSAAIEYVWSTSTAPHNDYAQYCFENASDGENIFFIKSCKRQTYIYMKPDSFLSQKSTRPREEGMFKVLRLQNNNWLISVIKYPVRFIYMTNTLFGRIKGSVTGNEYTNGLPTKQHEWSLT